MVATHVIRCDCGQMRITKWTYHTRACVCLIFSYVFPMLAWNVMVHSFCHMIT